MKWNLKIFTGIALIFSSFCMGIFSGILYIKQIEPLSIQNILIPEKIQMSVFEIISVSPFKLSGKTNNSPLRVIIDKNTIHIPKNQEFQIPLSSVFHNIQTSIPKNMQFFASKRGKKYYSIINKKQLAKMSVKNLIFFQTEDEAIKKGYKK
jgi:hypothetical protein